MIVKRSLLDLSEFVLIEQEFKFIQPENQTEVEAVFDQYVIDIDFSINTPDEVHFQILVKISINPDQQLPGYCITSTGVGFFDFSRTPSINQQEKRDFLQFSGISICINQLRGIMAALTANAPFGKYLLPAIDVNDLLKQKVDSLKKKDVKQSRKTKKG
jgi:preprotein translocase subunit SecB